MNFKTSAIILFLLISPIIIFAISNSIDIAHSSAFLGYFAAVLGGFLSGFITLMGVNKTIRHQNLEKYIESYPEKIKSLRLMIISIDNALGEDEEYEYDYNLLVKTIVELQKESATVSAKLFKKSLKMIEELNGPIYEIEDFVDGYVDPITGEDFTTSHEYLQEYKEVILTNLIEFRKVLINERNELNKMVEKLQP